MDGFWLQEEAEEGCGACEGGLQPEDVAPGTECDDDAADEGAKGGTNEGSAEEPAQGCCALGLWGVLVGEAAVVRV